MKTAPLFVHNDLGLPQFGNYEGVLKSSALTKIHGSKRFYRHKTWVYQLIVTDEVVVLYAIVDLKYASSAFVTALELSTGKVLDQSFLGLPGLSKVSISDEPAIGLRASFEANETKLQTAGYERGFSFRIVGQDVFLNAEAKTNFDKALTVIAPVEGGLVNVTQKVISNEVRGSLTIKNRSFDLGSGVMGLDYTQGYLARRTTWRWAMGMGRLADGIVFGFNIVEGINESENTNENTLWVNGEIYPLDRATFQWNKNNLMGPWSIETKDGKVRLQFTPKFIHQENKNLVLIKSTFAQPVGIFSGTIEYAGKSFSFQNIGGVTEFQDSTW